MAEGKHDGKTQNVPTETGKVSFAKKFVSEAGSDAKQTQLRKEK